MLDASFRICAPVFHRLRWIRSSLFLKEVSDVSQLVGNRFLKGHLLIMYIHVYIYLIYLYTYIYIFCSNIFYIYDTHALFILCACISFHWEGCASRVLSAAKKSALESLPIEPEMFLAKKNCAKLSMASHLVNRGPHHKVPPTEGLMALLKLPLVSLHEKPIVSEVTALGRRVFFSHETNTRVRERLTFHYTACLILLLMEEILHHLGYTKPCE